MALNTHVQLPPLTPSPKPRNSRTVRRKETFVELVCVSASGLWCWTRHRGAPRNLNLYVVAEGTSLSVLTDLDKLLWEIPRTQMPKGSFGNEYRWVRLLCNDCNSRRSILSWLPVAVRAKLC
jgi:hypothetical protein